MSSPTPLDPLNEKSEIPISDSPPAQVQAQTKQRNYKDIVLQSLFIILKIIMFVTGVLNVNDCPQQPMVPVYLIISGLLGVGIKLVHIINTKLEVKVIEWLVHILRCIEFIWMLIAEKDLMEFLTEEIVAEKKAQKSKTIPTEIDGFKAKLNGAEVTFTRTVGDETIKIQFNVNHTVDTEGEPEVTTEMDKPDIGELKSKPSFKVDLVHGNTTVSLVCSFLASDQQEDGYNDLFGIDEISIFEGNWNENIYSVSGEVVDSYLYDLLLNYLDEKGITNEFVEKLSEYSTAYEHSAYISLLEGLSKFASGK
ncbi:hypothetical protein FQA39_LY16178 [Lamprigera yunnana]|nr:hypothetical protein FQA39_LY16178 [Lamprigera yunnana]